MRTLALFLLLLVPATWCNSPAQTVGTDNDAKLFAYLKLHKKTPEAYVVSKFRDHDIVFIGEYHRIKHDVELIQKLVPLLYRARVYNLGIEFGSYENQDKVDQLINGKTYDEALARWLITQQDAAWGYKEYEDLYRAAWKVNHSLPSRARKFRIVNLGYRANWPARKNEMTPADWEKVWWQGDPDVHMANVVLNEFVKKGQKALIYSGNHHAFTRYHQPIYDFEKKMMWRFNTTRMGNLVYHKIGDRAFNIYLHAPWGSRANANVELRPMHGVIDEVMRQFGNRPVGFDVKGSPFGALRDDQSYYSLGYADFTLDKYCDGYIFQGRLEDSEGVTVDPLSVTESNLQETIPYLPNPQFRTRVKTSEDILAAMRRSADMKRRFHNVQ